MATYAVTIGGVSKTIREGSLFITETANGRNRLECDIYSADRSYRPDLDDEILITEDGTRIFGGVIDRPVEAGVVGVGAPGIVTHITAVDFNVFPSRRVLNVTIPTGTLKAALQVLDNYLATYGVTLDAGQVDGPTLPELTFSFMGYEDALNQIATISGYVWEVDYNKTFRMFLPSATSAPFNLTTGDGNTFGDITVEPSSQDYATRVLVLAGKGIQDVTDTLLGDGASQDFTLSYSLIAHRGTLTVGGVSKAVGVYGVDTMEWTYESAMNQLHHVGAPVGNGVAIVMGYTAQFPVLATAIDAGEEGDGHYQERLISYPDVFDVTVAQALADTTLARAVSQPRTVHYQSLSTGLHPGQTQTITIPERNLTGTWVITEVKIQNVLGGVVTRSVTALEGTDAGVDWRALYKSWGSGGSATSSVAGTVSLVGTGGGVGGTGTAGALAKWTASAMLGNSIISESGTTATVANTLSATTLQGSLAATYLTGTIDDARLSSNVPLKNAALNAFTQAMTIGTTLGVTGVVTVSDDMDPATNYVSDLGSIDKKYLTVHAAELWVETLVAQDTLATIGGRVIIAPTTTLTADLAPADTTIYVKHNNLASGDRVLLQAAGNLEWMAVTSAAGGGGPYSYSVTRNLDGSGANQWYAGDAVVNTGTTGDGFIDLYSVSGVLSGSGPTIVGNVRTGTTYSNIAPRWAIGNLNGLYGYASDLYGAAFGDSTAANLTIDATNGLRIRTGTTVYAQLASSTFTLGAGAGNRVTWDGTTLVVVSANLTIDSSGITLTNPGAYADANAYRFTAGSYSSGSICGLYSQDVSGPFRYLGLRNTVSGATGQAQSFIQAYNSNSGETATVSCYVNGFTGLKTVAIAGDLTVSDTSQFQKVAQFTQGLEYSGTSSYNPFVVWIDAFEKCLIDTNGDWRPYTDNTQRIGLATHRYTLIRGTTITPGDLLFENGWALTEGYKVGIAEPGIALVDDAGRLITFFGRDGLHGKSGRDVDALPYHVTTNAERSEMDRTPEVRVKGTDKRTGRTIYKTAADIRPLPDPATAIANHARG